MIRSKTATKRTAPKATDDIGKSDPPAKRAERLGYDLPEVPEVVEDVEDSVTYVTADKDSALAKRAKRKGYTLPESPETVVTETTLSVPLGSGDKK